jgi:hypothetical protein
VWLRSSSRGPPPRARESAANSQRHSERANDQRAALDLLVEPFQQIRRFQVLVMLARQTIEREGFFNIVLHPIAQLRIAFAPLVQPGSQIFGLCTGLSAKTSLGHDVPKPMTAPRRGGKGTSMTRGKDNAKKLNIKAVLAEQEEFLRGLSK